MPRSSPPDDLDPALAEAVRRLYAEPVDARRAARDVRVIATAARVADESRGPGLAAASRRRPRRAPFWRPALVVAAALVAAPAGLATAGVRLPGPLEAPYAAVGIELPHQGAAAPEPRERPATPVPATTSTGTAATPPPPAATTPAVPAAEPRDAVAPAKPRPKPKPKPKAAREPKGGRTPKGAQKPKRNAKAKGRANGRGGGKGRDR